MSTEKGVEDPTELMTTNSFELSRQTTGSSMTSTLSRNDFAYECAVVVITFVGILANGVVLYAMVVAKEHKKHVLIFNQNLLDFVSCLFLATMFTVRLFGIYLSGTSGYWLCLLFLNDGISWAAFLGSLINLAAITVERYLKIVHHVWAKNNLRKWMIYSAAVFSWIGASTSDVKRGQTDEIENETEAKLLRPKMRPDPRPRPLF